MDTVDASKIDYSKWDRLRSDESDEDFSMMDGNDIANLYAGLGLGSCSEAMEVLQSQAE